MRRRSALHLAFATVAACASSRAPGTPADEPSRPAPPPLAPGLEAGSLYRTAREAEFDAMIEELAKADVVYVGETHDNAEHHDIQLRVIRALAERGRLHGVGMEQFQRPFQAALDAYVEGRADEAELLERTEWKKRWNMDFGLYRPILEAARERRLPVIALNVTDEVRKASREGKLDELPSTVRASLPAPYLDDPDHRAFVRESYRGHLKEGEALDEAKFERFYRAMCLWDDVMADSVVRWFLTAPKDGQLVVLAGRGHIANRYGVPGRVFRRTGRPYATVVPVEAGGAGDVGFDRRYADFVWVTK